jgi:hypothetical protein
MLLGSRLKTKKHFEHWAATPSMRELELFIEGPTENLSRDLLALDRKQCRLVQVDR